MENNTICYGCNEPKAVHNIHSEGETVKFCNKCLQDWNRDNDETNENFTKFIAFSIGVVIVILFLWASK